jgi:hypothetical protein
MENRKMGKRKALSRREITRDGLMWWGGCRNAFLRDFGETVDGEPGFGK